MSIREIVLSYIKRGWSPIPVRTKSKEPTLKGWPDVRITESTIDQFFKGNLNVGVLLGQPSGTLVDIDLDSPEAMEFAPGLLPATATFGRAGKPRSHLLFNCDGHGSVRFEDPAANENGHDALLFEIHSTGRQTVFPGSTHPTGERISWDVDMTPTTIGADELAKRARHLAAICLLKRYWPAPGGRHPAAMAVIGFLARNGIDPQTIAEVVTAINGGADLQKHIRLAEDAVARASNDRPLDGIPKLAAVFGDKVTAQIVKWLRAPGKPTRSDMSEAVERLSLQSTPEAISEAMSSLHAANLSRLDVEDILAAIKRRTGKSITTLRNQYSSLRKGRKRQPSNQAQELVAIGMMAELFRDEESGDPFAFIEVGDHMETHRIAEGSFCQWLAHSLYEQTGAVPDRAATSSAINVLSGVALIRGAKHRTWLRVAQHEGSIYVDLGDSTWRAVRISPDGWDVISNPPVRFRRDGGHALPEPERGGSIQDLRPFVNADEQGFLLIVGVVVNAFRPDKPFPILLLTGEKGTAKSTLLVLLRQLIDPASAPGAGLPSNETDLVIVAQNNWLVSGDNVSDIWARMADALCRLSTGGGLRKRRLYSDGAQYTIEVRRPVILTALFAVTDREDFLDREVMVTLKRIEANRKTEEQVLKEFAAVRARILGALFDGVSAGLRFLPSIVMEELPRMADFVLFATAAGKHYGWEEYEFKKTYELMQHAVFEDSAMSDPVIEFIAQWMNQQDANSPGFDGSPSELLRHLTNHAEVYNEQLLRRREWPKSPSTLVKRLRAGRSGLLQLGIDATAIRDNDNRSRIILVYVAETRDLPELPF